MTNLEEIITRRQDELRGRPRNWRDGLSDWWRTFSFYDTFFMVWVWVSMLWLTVALSGLAFYAVKLFLSR